MKIVEEQSLQELYEDTAREFAERVKARFGEKIRSLVPYGSVARKTAGSDSDIDVLVLADEGEALRRYQAHALMTPEGVGEVLDKAEGFLDRIRAFLGEEER